VDRIEDESGPIIVVADTHLGLLAGQRFYLIKNNVQSDLLGLSDFLEWLKRLETSTESVIRGKWGDALEIRKPNLLILLGDYIELWDASDTAVELSSRSIWNTMEQLTCQKIHLMGNHDSAYSQTLGQFPHGASTIRILPDTYPMSKDLTRWLKVGNANYLFIHGHQFDSTFRYLGNLWMIMSAIRDGAEAFRLWSGIIVASAFVTWGLSLQNLIQLPISSSNLLAIALTLSVAGALPTMMVALARPIWNRFFETRYDPKKALKGFAEWWKNDVGQKEIPEGQLCVVYGHTHVMGLHDCSDIQETVKAEFPKELHLINIPAWVSDVRAEYREIIRDAALYVDSNGFHLLGWDWNKCKPFYIPPDVIGNISSVSHIDEQTARSLAEIGWPKKLLSKLRVPPIVLTLLEPIDTVILKAMSFVDSLRVDDNRCEYREVAEQNHSEYRVYNQSQYLLSVVFKLLGRDDLAQAIRNKHDPNEGDNDPKREGRKAGDRFCVLEGDLEHFYLKNRVFLDSEKNDEIALKALYCLQKKPDWMYGRNAKKSWEKLRSRYDSSKGVLRMDESDLERNLYPVYKVALLGLLAKEMGDKEIVTRVREDLRKWQHSDGGWVTDRNINMDPDGVANLETTALAILALID